jgi:hypothetical protein
LIHGQQLVLYPWPEACTFNIGMGDKFDEKATKVMAATGMVVEAGYVGAGLALRILILAVTTTIAVAGAAIYRPL